MISSNKRSEFSVAAFNVGIALWVLINFVFLAWVAAEVWLMKEPRFGDTFQIIWLMFWVSQVYCGGKTLNLLGEQNLVWPGLLRALHYNLHYFEPFFRQMLYPCMAIVGGVLLNHAFDGTDSSPGTAERVSLVLNVLAWFWFFFLLLAGGAVILPLFDRWRSDYDAFLARIRPPENQ